MLPEKHDGKIEYKWKLIDKDENRIQKLQSQMKFRMEEGNGECIYKLGVADDGEIKGITLKEYTQTFSLINIIAIKNNYFINKICTKPVDGDKNIYELLIREKNTSNYIDIKVAIKGGVDAGKSTLLSILTHGKLDDGRGSARNNIFNYPHEIKTGRTSSLAHHIMGFDEKGEIVNYNTLSKSPWPEIVKNSNKIISFVDMAGHEKYLKTTISGISSCCPDFSMIIIGANMGVSKMTKEHLFLSLTLKIPFIIVLTKMDIVENRKNVYNETLSNIKKILKLPGIRHIPYRVNTDDDITMCAEKLHTNSFTPIFEVSNVTGMGIDNLRKFFNYVQKINKNYKKENPFEYHIDCMFKNIKGTSIVVGGNVLNGTVHVNDKMLLGPISGKFHEVTIKSIHCKRVPLQELSKCTYACFSIKGIDKDIIRKGHVIVHKNANPKPIWQMDCTIQVLKSHSTTIKLGYEPVLNSCNIRQSVRLIEIKEKLTSKHDKDDNQCLRVGDKARVTFHFVFRSEFVKEKYRFFLSEGRTKIIGIVNTVSEIKLF